MFCKLSNFSAERAKKFKSKVLFVSTAVALMLFVPRKRSSLFYKCKSLFINR